MSLKRIGGDLLVASVAALATFGSAGLAAACVTRPTNLASNSLASEGGNLKVEKGALVYVVIGEPEKYLTAGDPRVFPWLKPTVSSNVLAAVKLCPMREVSTLPERVSAFRATETGTAKIVARLSPAWRDAAPRRRRGLRAFRSSVTVTG